MWLGGWHIISSQIYCFEVELCDLGLEKEVLALALALTNFLVIGLG